VRITANKWRFVAGLISPTGRLHLESIGTLVGKQLGAKRAGRPIAHF
jgi:hypothetical protein